VQCTRAGGGAALIQLLASFEDGGDGDGVGGGEHGRE
jgi:hypothetical protein